MRECARRPVGIRIRPDYTGVPEKTRDVRIFRLENMKADHRRE